MTETLDSEQLDALIQELKRFEGRQGSFRIGTDDNDLILKALRIAAAVLDDGAVEKLAYALRAVGGLYDPSGARAVLSYLREKRSE